MENYNTFLANFAHEVKTPLCSVCGYIQLLQQTKLDTTQKNYTFALNKCCGQLVEMINDLLDYSRISNGKMELNNICFSLQELASELTATIEYRVKEKRQKFRIVLGDNIPEYIIADKQKILQVLVNLTFNAVKFTQPEGRIIVQMGTENETLTFSIEDNGPGIDTKDQEKLFKPFSQLQTTGEKSGCGLGLAISKKLVELMQGTIGLESEKDQGSVFHFTVKYDEYEKFQKIIEKNIKFLHDKFILVIDGCVDTRLALTELLFEYTRPIICSSVKEGLRMISGKRYPFVATIIDSNVIDEKTMETFILQEIPTIVIGETSFHDPQKIVPKPINKIKLLDTLYRCINNTSQFQLNENDPLPISSIKDLKILVAEDIEYNREMLVEMLKSLGYINIQSCSNGEEAIENMIKIPYDIVLLDLRMPIKSGLEVVEWIRKNERKEKIAIITASIQESDRHTCRELGVKYFLLKPFSMVHLKSILYKLVNGTQR